MIDRYQFGMMVVDGKKYTADLIILPERIISSWWRKEGHSLCLEDLAVVINENIDVLVVGTGFMGLMKVRPEVWRAFQTKGTILLAEKTSQAVETFNRLALQKRAAGAFHLTC